MQCLKACKMTTYIGVERVIHGKSMQTFRGRIHWSEQWEGLGRYLLCFVKKGSKANMEKMLRIVYFGYRYKGAYNIIIFFLYV